MVNSKALINRAEKAMLNYILFSVLSYGGLSVLFYAVLYYFDVRQQKRKGQQKLFKPFEVLLLIAGGLFVVVTLLPMFSR
ncbi:MAG: hypothetical protein AAF193_01145 [Bacteroidota bacterium]